MLLKKRKGPLHLTRSVKEVRLSHLWNDPPHLSLCLHFWYVPVVMSLRQNLSASLPPNTISHTDLALSKAREPPEERDESTSPCLRNCSTIVDLMFHELIYGQVGSQSELDDDSSICCRAQSADRQPKAKYQAPDAVLLVWMCSSCSGP